MGFIIRGKMIFRSWVTVKGFTSRFRFWAAVKIEVKVSFRLEVVMIEITASLQAMNVSQRYIPRK